ncbi:hypothetical protein [Rhodococcus sp. Leaf233]|uniref:hypothetical protein n=1 Tax=Rhodococcus sp. Leaf233 TaxID=1736302 RepID=UPI00070DCDB5|nr:hypothetical protein [Rhodococcus sp. Leaf233]KQU33528.1 hypothetical protein ASH04_06740 [Rhodococcus sp. Leaf233]
MSEPLDLDLDAIEKLAKLAREETFRPGWPYGGSGEWTENVIGMLGGATGDFAGGMSPDVVDALLARIRALESQPSRVHHDELDAIQARADAASSAPWVWRDGNNPRAGIYGSVRDANGDYVSGSFDVRDAEFIAHARTDIPALIARVRALEPRVLEGDWGTVRDALDSLPEGAQIRWRANGSRALPTLGIKITNVIGHASWSTTGLGILKATTIARDETPIEVIA